MKPKKPSVQKEDYEKPADQKKPVLSVIIPTYNLENYLERCLDSVLAQQIEDMEIIIVDDCSTDKTWDIIQKYSRKYKQIVPISLTVNQGPSAARNAALDVAKGEFIHFCDGDDSVPRKAYQELLRVARVEDADIVTGNYSRQYPDEHNVIKRFSHYKARTGIDRCFESGNTMLWNKIYRREMIEKNHLRFNVSMTTYEDFLFYSQFIMNEPKAAYTDMYVYIYTEPSTRNVNSCIRYANLSCASNLNKAWREILSNNISGKQKLWREMYRHNLDWYFNWSWKWIQDLQVKKQAFAILRDLICWVEQTVKFFSWFSSRGTPKFYGIFHIDYATFCSIRCEDYLLHLAVLENIHPRKPSATADKEWKRGCPYDDVLRKNIEEELADLRAAYQNSHMNKLRWKDHYWNLMDCIVNDYWRQLQDAKEKEALFKEIGEQICDDFEKNPYLRLSTTDDVWRFKQIFCVDYVTLQVLDVSQYMAVCIPRFTGGRGDYTPKQQMEYYVAACQNGQLGLRGILKGLLGWMKYKLTRWK